MVHTFSHIPVLCRNSTKCRSAILFSLSCVRICNDDELPRACLLLCPASVHNCSHRGSAAGKSSAKSSAIVITILLYGVITKEIIIEENKCHKCILKNY